MGDDESIDGEFYTVTTQLCNNMVIKPTLVLMTDEELYGNENVNEIIKTAQSGVSALKGEELDNGSNKRTKYMDKEKDLVPVDSDKFRDRAIVVDNEILIRPKKENIQWTNNLGNIIESVTTSIGGIPIDHIRSDGTQVTNFGGKIYQHSDGSWHDIDEEEAELWKEIYEELIKKDKV